MGKAYANRKKAEERHANDKYETPYSLTWELQKLNIVKPNTTMLDPCCGNHAISKWFRINERKHSTLQGGIYKRVEKKNNYLTI